MLIIIYFELGPLPNSKYLLVAIDQYSRYPVVEIISSTSANCTISALEKIFSEHRLPQRIIYDNGPPFKSSQISAYKKNSRITHNRITPLHPRANEIVESFKRNLNKILCIADMQKRNWKLALYNYLLADRVSPNMSTKAPPALFLNNKIPRTKIPTVNHEIDNRVHQKLEAHDRIIKDKMKKYFHSRYYMKNSQMHIGDCVLVKQPRLNKLTPPFDPDPYFVKCVKGSMVTAERRNKSITRNKEHFILLPNFTKNKLNYRNTTNNSENDDDFDFDLAKPTTENGNNPSPPIRRYPVRTRSPLSFTMS